MQFEQSGLELISLDLLNCDTKDSVAIITLSNGLAHEKVKAELCKKGDS